MKLAQFVYIINSLNLIDFEKNQTISRSHINPFPNKPWFLRACRISLSKTHWEKEKLLVMSNFSFFYSVFYLFGEHPAIFIRFKIVVCKLFQFGRVLKFVIWERVKLKICISCLRDTVCIFGQIFMKHAQFICIINSFNPIDLNKI